MEKMDDEQAPVKAKSFVVNGLIKRQIEEEMERGCSKKGMLARGLKRSGAQDCTVWRLGCKNRPTTAQREIKLGSRKMKLINTSRTNG